MPQHPWNEVGRGLLAVMKAHRLGLASIDYTLKRYVPEEVEFFWADLAEQIDRQMSEAIAKAILPDAPPDDSSKSVQ